MQTLFFSHIFLAYISLSLLLLRGVLSAKRVNWRQIKILKIAPHLVDTLLLLTGIGLFIFVGYEVENWLIGKIVFLFLYIFFAIKAFNLKKLFSQKHFILAVVSFMMILILATMR